MRISIFSITIALFTSVFATAQYSGGHGSGYGVADMMNASTKIVPSIPDKKELKMMVPSISKDQSVLINFESSVNISNGVLTIRDMKGSELYKDDKVNVIAKNLIVNVPGLSPGLYLVYLRDDKYQGKAFLIVQ